jgi:GNAT superfamily N-acetyltransferase
MHEKPRDGFLISTDPARLPLDDIWKALAKTYWASGRSRETVARSLENSLCFGLYEGERLAGFARVVTDRATFAWLCDVFIGEEYRGRGLGKWLVEEVLSHPDLQGLRRWLLATRDAHSLYARHGFAPLQGPERWMEIFRPDPPLVESGSEG